MNVYVPYRPTAWRPPRARVAQAVPYRTRGLGFLGDASTLAKSATTAYTGATLGTAAGSIVIGGATSVAGAVGSAAAAGSFVPVIGTAIGVIIGLVASGVFNHRADPEVANFNAAVQLFNQQGVNGIMNIANKYLVLAGLFDLEPSQIKGNIPIYKKYGRMGEAKFTADLVRLIYNAAQQGRITANDTVDTVYANIVAPWIASFGYGAMSDANGEMITDIIIGLIAEYITGLWKQRWFSRSGPMPTEFSSLPTFALPAASTQTLAPSPALPPIAPVASVPTASLPTNSTPGLASPVPGTPEYMLSAGYQIIGTDPLYGNIYRAVGQTQSVVLVNGNAVPYQQQIPSLASQLPSVGTPGAATLPASPMQAVAPSVSYTPPQYAGGGPVPYAADSGIPIAPAQPVQQAGVFSSTNPWLIAGAGVVVLGMLLSMGRHQKTPARRA